MSFLIFILFTGQTEPRGDASFEAVGESADTNDFLSRERALLGDDADQFATSNDNAATVEVAGDEDDDEDLLGGTSGGGGGGSSDMAGFESSFPAIDASNEVSLCTNLNISVRSMAMNNNMLFTLHSKWHQAEQSPALPPLSSPANPNLTPPPLTTTTNPKKTNQK